MASPPRLSICLPVFNGENYLAEAIESVLCQTFGDFELLISDNCSTDRTEEICQSYGGKDRRVSYTRRERNIGANGNMNFLVHSARAEYFSLIGHDDMMRPMFAENCLRELDSHRDIVLCFSLVDFIGSHGENIPCPYAPLHCAHVAEEQDPVERFRVFGRNAYFGEHLYGVIRRSALLKTRLFEPYYGSDNVILADLALRGRFKTINETLFSRRIHPASTYTMTHRQRQEYAAPGHPRWFNPLADSKAYARTVLNVRDLTSWQQVRSLLIVAGRVVQLLGRGVRKRLNRVRVHAEA